MLKMVTGSIVVAAASPLVLVAGIAALGTEVRTTAEAAGSGDFAGLLHPSRSDSGPQPRSAESVVAGLHALLRAADVPGPYVLVGHSLGGLFVRLDTATYPVPGASFTVATESSHFIRSQQPALVIEVIREVVAGVRDPSTWCVVAK